MPGSSLERTRDPNNARAYCSRAMAYRNLGNSSASLADFKEAMQRDPGVVLAHRDMMQVFNGLG